MKNLRLSLPMSGRILYEDFRLYCLIGDPMKQYITSVEAWVLYTTRTIRNMSVPTNYHFNPNMEENHA